MGFLDETIKEINQLVERDTQLSSIYKYIEGSKCDTKCQEEKKVIRSLLRYIKECQDKESSHYKQSLSRNEINRIERKYIK